MCRHSLNCNTIYVRICTRILSVSSTVCLLNNASRYCTFVFIMIQEVSLLRSKVKDNNTLKELTLLDNAVSILECISVSRSIEKLTLHSECSDDHFHVECST